MFEQLEKFDEMQKKKKQKKKKIITIISMLLILIIIAAIGIYLYLNMEKPTKKKKEKQIKIVDMNSNKRPLAVMIDNNVGTSSHAGLQDAYITYEAIVEGGLTRIMAIYKDKDVDLIGPVRSSRHYFLDYALENDAIYAHYGWSTYAENDIKELGVNNLNGMIPKEEGAYWRDKNIASPHNVFTSTEKLYETAKDNKYDITSEDWQLLDYSAKNIKLNNTKTRNDDTEEIDEEDSAIIANEIEIPYSNSQVRTYTYDEENKVYLRFMNGEKHLDKKTKEQLHYKNIIIEYVDNHTIDDYGRQDLDTSGSGEGYYITNGYAKKIKWTKSSRSDKIKYEYEDGSKVKVNDGNTFIQIQPANLESTFE